MWDIRRSIASPRPPCNVTLSASVRPSPRKMPGLTRPYLGLQLTQLRDRGRSPSMRENPTTQIPTRQDPMGGILCKESRHMPVEAQLTLPMRNSNHRKSEHSSIFAIIRHSLCSHKQVRLSMSKSVPLTTFKVYDNSKNTMLIYAFTVFP